LNLRDAGTGTILLRKRGNLLGERNRPLGGGGGTQLRNQKKDGKDAVVQGGKFHRWGSTDFTKKDRDLRKENTYGHKDAGESICLQLPEIY